MTSLGSMRHSLETARRAVPALEHFSDDAAASTARRLLERLDRDLLPRLGGETPLLLVGIAGPNNVGKSTLFNSLVGSALSPARPEGGLTKQCLAAMNPKMASEAVRGWLSQRYEVTEAGLSPPIDQPGPAGRLYLALVESIPPGLLVMDTPDFDSVYRDNRLRAEALLVTVDLMVFVISRQTYQNAALVEFLRSAVGHGKPYLLVYNEMTREEVARGHLQKLAQDVGHPPIASYVAGYQADVEAGTALLRTEGLDSAVSLGQLLSDPQSVEALKTRALAASIADARAEMRLLAEAAERAALEPNRLRQRLRHELATVGERAALKTVPADVLIDAFRDELDARSSLHRWVRLPFRGLATALTVITRGVRIAFTGPQQKAASAEDATHGVLRDGLRRVLEALAPEVASWAGDRATRDALVAGLGPGTMKRLEETLDDEAFKVHSSDRESLYQFCRRLVSEELSAGKLNEQVLQTLTTLVYSVPSGAAAIATVATGGFGHDAVIWAGTLLSTPLLEKFVDLLGADVRSRVTQKWAEARGATLAQALEARFFKDLLARLDTAAKVWEDAAALLGQSARALEE